MAATGSSYALLECPKCGARRDPDSDAHLCACGSPLLARYDLEKAAHGLTRETIEARPDDLMGRWRELLPIRDDSFRVSLGERMTPIVALPALGESIRVPGFAIKDEGTLPTGSFKARGAAIGVSRANELGVRAFAMPTNGNAGAAWATYGRRAGMQAFVAIPRNAPAMHRTDCVEAGAQVTDVDGTIADAGKVVGQWVRERELYDASTLKEPYRIEGKKTLGFEIALQHGWDVPDVILYPTGGGVGLIGIEKALRELYAIGIIGEKMPRLVAVQSSGCAPIVEAWRTGRRESTFWNDSMTVAFGINVPKAIGDFLILDAIYRTNGCAVAVGDDEILAARKQVTALDGVALCLEGAATIAAAQRLRAEGWIAPGNRVLALNTSVARRQDD